MIVNNFKRASEATNDKHAGEETLQQDLQRMVIPDTVAMTVLKVNRFKEMHTDVLKNLHDEIGACMNARSHSWSPIFDELYRRITLIDTISTGRIFVGVHGARGKSSFVNQILGHSLTTPGLVRPTVRSPRTAPVVLGGLMCFGYADTPMYAILPRCSPILVAHQLIDINVGLAYSQLMSYDKTIVTSTPTLPTFVPITDPNYAQTMRTIIENAELKTVQTHSTFNDNILFLAPFPYLASSSNMKQVVLCDFPIAAANEITTAALMMDVWVDCETRVPTSTDLTINIFAGGQYLNINTPGITGVYPGDAPSHLSVDASIQREFAENIKACIDMNTKMFALPTWNTNELLCSSQTDTSLVVLCATHQISQPDVVALINNWSINRSSRIMNLYKSAVQSFVCMAHVICKPLQGELAIHFPQYDEDEVVYICTHACQWIFDFHSKMSTAAISKLLATRMRIINANILIATSTKCASVVYDHKKSRHRREWGATKVSDLQLLFRTIDSSKLTADIDNVLPVATYMAQIARAINDGVPLREFCQTVIKPQIIADIPAAVKNIMDTTFKSYMDARAHQVSTPSQVFELIQGCRRDLHGLYSESAYLTYQMPCFPLSIINGKCANIAYRINRPSSTTYNISSRQIYENLTTPKCCIRGEELEATPTPTNKHMRIIVGSGGQATIIQTSPSATAVIDNMIKLWKRPNTPLATHPIWFFVSNDGQIDPTCAQMMAKMTQDSPMVQCLYFIATPVAPGENPSTRLMSYGELSRVVVVSIECTPSKFHIEVLDAAKQVSCHLGFNQMFVASPRISTCREINTTHDKTYNCSLLRNTISLSNYSLRYLIIAYQYLIKNIAYIPPLFWMAVMDALESTTSVNQHQHKIAEHTLHQLQTGDLSIIRTITAYDLALLGDVMAQTDEHLSGLIAALPTNVVISNASEILTKWRSLQLDLQLVIGCHQITCIFTGSSVNLLDQSHRHNQFVGTPYFEEPTEILLAVIDTIHTSPRFFAETSTMTHIDNIDQLHVDHIIARVLANVVGNVHQKTPERVVKFLLTGVDSTHPLSPSN